MKFARLAHQAHIPLNDSDPVYSPPELTWPLHAHHTGHRADRRNRNTRLSPHSDLREITHIYYYVHRARVGDTHGKKCHVFSLTKTHYLAQYDSALPCGPALDNSELKQKMTHCMSIGQHKSRDQNIGL